MATQKPTYKTDWTGDPKSHPLSEFKESITGTCLCGSISVTVHQNLWEKPQGHLCHCENCRKVSGSFISSNLALPQSSVSISDPQNTLKTYEDYNTGSGNVVKRSFCSGCGSPICSHPAIAPNMIILKMGIFPRIPKPEAESFVAHRQDWEDERPGGLEGVVLYETVRGEKKFKAK